MQTTWSNVHPDTAAAKLEAAAALRDIRPEDIYYRMEDRRYSVANWDGDHSHTRYDIVLIGYQVLRRTPKGVWLQVGAQERFVLAAAIKQFATASWEEALQQFLARKRKQLAIYRARARAVEVVMAMADLSDL